MGILERGGEIRTAVVPSRRKKVLQGEVRRHVKAGAALYTDALLSYQGLAGEYAHQVIDHAVEYVNGRIHMNGLEKKATSKSRCTSKTASTPMLLGNSRPASG